MFAQLIFIIMHLLRVQITVRRLLRNVAPIIFLLGGVCGDPVPQFHQP